MISVATAAAAEKQMDQLQSLFNAIVLAAVVIMLADIESSKKVSFLGLEMDTSQAFGFAACAFFLLTLMMAQLFARLTDLLQLADPEEEPKIAGVILNHVWSFNPFSYFGPKNVASLHASFGLGMLILVWWLALTALALLWGRLEFTKGLWEYGFWYANLIAGFLALVSIVRTQCNLYTSVGKTKNESEHGNVALRHGMKRVVIARHVIAAAFTALGFWIYYSFTHIGA